MWWWRPVPVSVLVAVLLVLIVISWGPSLFFYENWVASIISLTRITSAVDTDVHPSDAHPHALTTHSHPINAPSHTTTITATDAGHRNNQSNTEDIPTNSTNSQAYDSPNTTTTTSCDDTPAGAPSDAASDEECAEQYQEEGPMRRVVLWTPFWHSWDGWKGMIRDHGALRKGRCAIWRCEFLWGSNVTTDQVEEADALIFFSLDVLMRPLPPRHPHTLWIWLELEAFIMSKAGGKMKAMKKAVDKVVHGNLIKTNIPAGMAIAGPPLGPMLGQRGLNIAAFCKDFNARTAHFIEGVPLPCRILVRSDRSYELTIHNPPSTYFIKQAAGIQRGAMSPGKEVAGKITLKHVYEIAKIKQQDPPLVLTPLKEICELVIGSAHSCGVEVVRDLDAKEYEEFLNERKLVVEEQQQELQEKKEAKLLRK
ncbi:uncharacterized protein LOC123516553 isoform X1 [Portunus trituberculatus]|uniref:uncharacterized protein LOC123516553 isoform X1 n=1 Tax=Portunus trituberculatus TaxID=210409 RepID=UPI001E1CDCBC|nr:uncharacterized protein LOC123516553 isoform X1 [Portunus trituberculatus]XP_045131965.1 uncharacterized protein LOC123516553 isoform X1 [Portunus trituberculatus]